MKASILAIGTELTLGQIPNKNAATLSEKLRKLGVTVSAHLTVPDEHALILEAMNFVAPVSDLIFVTGGLGPTSDDFTRDVLATWGDKKMRFDEASWKHIQERLSSRGFQVREMQRQQCYYPENADVLFNSEGTAHGFSFQAKGKTIFALPGPPREIEAIWKGGLEKTLISLCSGLNRHMTRSWDTLGYGESDIAAHVETALKDRPSDRPSEIGYRVHHPYVEVKFSFYEQDADYFKPWVEKVDKALESACVAKDFADVAQLVSTKISKYDFTFYDFVTQGFLFGRLSPFIKNAPAWAFKQGPTDSAPGADFFHHEDNFLSLTSMDDNNCIVMFSVEGRRGQATIQSPIKSNVMSERRRQYFAEMALITLSKAL